MVALRIEPGAFFQQPLRALRSLPTQWPELAPFESIVGNEELLHFLKELVADVVQRLKSGSIVRGVQCRQEPIIAGRLAFFYLLRLEHAQQSHWNDAAGKSRCIHQNEHVERIAIIPSSRGDEAKIMRKGHA